MSRGRVSEIEMSDMYDKSSNPVEAPSPSSSFTLSQIREIFGEAVPKSPLLDEIEQRERERKEKKEERIAKKEKIKDILKHHNSWRNPNHYDTPPTSPSATRASSPIKSSGIDSSSMR